jgi:hypothetical protein
MLEGGRGAVGAGNEYKKESTGTGIFRHAGQHE